MKRPSPAKIYAEITTRCNLRCAKCVKFAPGSEIRDADMTATTFRHLLPALGKSTSLILTGIGEPLLHPLLLDFIHLAREVMGENPAIGLQSNGALLNVDLAKKLIRAGLSTICFSIDSLVVQNTEREHSFQAAANGIHHLQKAAAEGKSPVKIGVEMVIHRDNLSELPALIHWAADNRLDYLIISHLIPYGAEDEQLMVFEPYPLDVYTIFQKHMAAAQEAGVNLRNRFGEYLRFAGTRTDSRTLAFFSAIRTESRNRGHLVNLKRLFETDEQLLQQAEITFERAAQLARQYSIELTLPPLFAPGEQDRCCDFIQDGAIFIDVFGNISPCHFLWHTYQRYLNNESIRIEQRILGNINHTPLTTAWQQQEHCSFRQEAGRSAFSHCGSCSVAPCPTLINDNLSGGYDCFGSRVPCGHCHWSLGGYKCL